MKLMSKLRWSSICVGLVLFVAMTTSSSPLLAQDVEVNSADPNNTPQGSTSLNVVITGKHFERGHQAKFYVSEAIRHGLSIGGGHGPLDHFWNGVAGHD